MDVEEQSQASGGQEPRKPPPLAPGLHIVATPIGNLRDITFRAIDVLRGADLIACEDTRVFAKLASHYGISVPTVAYSDATQDLAEPRIVRALAAGKRVALVSDAGMPLISDPGYRLVQAAIAGGHAVTSAPGPSAVPMALALSGLPTDRFYFGGFLPARDGDRRRAIGAAAATPATPSAPGTAGTKPMDAIMALCKRRGFIYQASEIYGGINGFWDYGPLGAQLKKNLRDAWWEDMIMRPCWGRKGPNGREVTCVPVETCIIQHPKVWEASGHVAGFNDPMVDCKETKGRYRYDHVSVFVPASGNQGDKPVFAYIGDQPSEAKQKKKAEKTFGEVSSVALSSLPKPWDRVIGPDAEKPGTLTEPRMFNLMFDTIPGAIRDEANRAYLRPETAQGVFVQAKNVWDTTRVRVPFGIGNTGRSFRNEVTPRNFTFRSREFEQAELEFFCHPGESHDWYRFWRDFRMEWWKSIGLAGDNLILREHDKDELSHYSVGTSDVEYRFPFTAPGFGELEGIAHRGNFDLTQHAKHSGAKMEYNDTERGEVLPNGSRRGERYIPHCIEPAAGLDRGALALICEGYTRDESRPSPEFMKFHPRVAPIKAAIFPLVNKDGMPEAAERLHTELNNRFWRLGAVEMDEKQSIGKRYARMDEAGCPYCFTIDGDTLKDQTVTMRDRDSGQQTRMAMDKVKGFLEEKLGV